MTRQNDEQPVISAAIVVREGRVLMVRRRMREGELSWQFPAGGTEPGESPGEAAVRETLEETGLTVSAVEFLGGRVHPETKRLMSYTACDVLSGTAHIADEDELAELAWVARAELAVYVPYGLFEPVREYLDDALAR
ncbi:NUDIX hydrolase [Streptomyces sp. NPDC058864]